MYSLIRLQVLASCALLCLAFLPNAHATPDPGVVHGILNTADGQSALVSAGGSAAGNAAVGFLALGSNTTGSFNAALGARALATSNGASNTAVGAVSLFANTADNTVSVLLGN